MEKKKGAIAGRKVPQARTKKKPVAGAVKKQIATEVNKERLAIVFYGLASMYYLLQLFEKMQEHIDWSTGLNLAGNKFFNFGLQVLTISIMLFRKRMN